jgi:hypothetical protein
MVEKNCSPHSSQEAKMLKKSPNTKKFQYKRKDMHTFFSSLSIPPFWGYLGLELKASHLISSILPLEPLHQPF